MISDVFNPSSNSPVDRAETALIMLRGHNFAVNAVLADIMEVGSPGSTADQSGIMLFLEWSGDALVEEVKKAVAELTEGRVAPRTEPTSDPARPSDAI